MQNIHSIYNKPCIQCLIQYNLFKIQNMQSTITKCMYDTKHAKKTAIPKVYNTKHTINSTKHTMMNGKHKMSKKTIKTHKI